MDEIIQFIDLLDNETLNKIRHTKSDAEIRRLLKNKIKNPKSMFQEINKTLIKDGWRISEINETKIICLEQSIGKLKCEMQCDKCKNNSYFTNTKDLDMRKPIG